MSIENEAFAMSCWELRYDNTADVRTDVSISKPILRGKGRGKRKKEVTSRRATVCVRSRSS